MKETRVIDSELKVLFDQMPGAWGCKDENSVFIYANKEYGRIIGLPHHEDVIGRTDYDMPCETVNCAGLFRAQDQQVIQTVKCMRILDIHPFAGGEWKAYVFTKTPLMTKDKNIVGTIFHGVDITNASSIEIGSLLARMQVEGVRNELLGQNSYVIGNNFSKIKLTARQAECLFFILRGRTTKQIAKILNISFRTVDEHYENLRLKFQSQNRYELIDKAIAGGFLNMIPERLFNTQLSVILRD